MKKIGSKLWSGRLLTVAALFGVTLMAVLAVPLLVSADEPVGDRQANPPPDVAACLDRVALDDPFRDSFLDELVTDGVISTEQAAEIDARLDDKHFDGCVARILWERGNAIEATAAATGAAKREVVGALIAGESLSEFANARGVDDETLIAAIMAGPEAKAAELVASGQLSQAEIDRILARIEERVSAGIHVTDVAPRRFGGVFDLAGGQL